jgi:hypothetical protein
MTETMQEFHISNEHGLSITEKFESMDDARTFAREHYGLPISVEKV